MTGLPQPGTPWPPKPYDQVLDACAEWQAWWVGDPTALRSYYGGGKVAAFDTTSTARSLTARSKRAWSAFWGKQTPTLNQPKKLHVPVAADLGRIAASTLLSEPVTFTPDDADKDLADLVDDVLNTDDNYSRMLVAEESASMLSGVYGRIVWDKNVADHTWIDYVDTDRAIPEFKWGKLVGCTFWTELDSDSDNIVLRHLEHYSKGRVEHALYQGTSTDLGRVIPLTEHPDTADIRVTDGGFVDLAGVDELGVEYFPNMRPNPQWRNEPALRHLGRSDLSIDVLQLLDAIDEVWSSWMRDIDLGKARVFVTEGLLTNRGPGQGSTFDTDQAIYSPIGQMVKEGESTSHIQAEQFAIRVDEHRSTFEALLRQVLGRVGYSPLTFGLSDEVAATATEIGAKERDTSRTRSSKIRLRSGLSRLVTTQMRVEAAVFGGTAPTETIRVEWPDADQASPREVAETAELLKRAEAASTQTRVQMVHPDWTPEQVDEEVSRIQDESSAPISILGPGESNFGGPAADEDESEQPTDGPEEGEPAPFGQ